MSPTVDVTIPVHSEARPIARAVRSVLSGTLADVRVTVVAHNIDAAVIERNLGGLAGDARVRMLSLGDGIFSPAGPLNAGLAASDADFLVVLGSDDELAPGAIDSWLDRQSRTGAAMVIARIFHVGRGNDAFPPVRPGRTRNLDGIKDRLTYRSAPLGLISARVFGHLRFTEGLASGEDLAFVNEMWFSGQPIAFDRSGPAYLVHHEAEDRVSFAPRPVAGDFAFLDALLGSSWFPQMSARQREALVVKLLRVNVFDAILARSATLPWPVGERAALRDVVERLFSVAPSARDLLSRADRTALEHLLDHEPTSATFSAVLRARWNYGSIGAATPRKLTFALHRQAPLRTLAAGFLLRQTRNR